jgi:hypothetical protein
MRYTHGLSIQYEGGSHIVGPCERAYDSSFLLDMPMGRMLRNINTFRGYVGAGGALAGGLLYF